MYPMLTPRQASCLSVILHAHTAGPLSPVNGMAAGLRKLQPSKSGP